MSKKEFGWQMAKDPFDIGKFLAIICGQDMQTIRERLQQFNHCVPHLVCRALIDLGQQAKARFFVPSGWQWLDDALCR